MIAARVFVTGVVLAHPEVVELLLKEPELELETGENRVYQKDELLEKVKGKDGVLLTVMEKVDAEVLDAAGCQLKAISLYGSGFNHIDLHEVIKRKITVTCTASAQAESVADFTFGIMLSVARRIRQAVEFAKGGKVVIPTPPPLIGADVHGKVLGIIGLGKIGLAVAARARGFGMRILAYHPDKFGKEQRGNVEFVTLEQLLKESDFVTLHVPLNSRTRRLLGERELSMMKSSAFLVNTSRGEVLEQGVLIRLLKENKIQGAALDVYEGEPEIPRDLLSLPNVLLTPHIGSSTVETRKRMAIQSAQNLLCILKGKEPLDLVAVLKLGED